jgi:Protein of unknown function (DUF3631)
MNRWDSTPRLAGQWANRGRAAARALVGAGKDAEPSLGVRLLTDLRTVFGDKTEMPTAAIIKALHGLEESPWADLKGKPLDDRGLAHQLRQYGIKSTRKWFGDKQARGYERAAFTDAWSRYLPRSGENSVTGVTAISACEKPAVFEQSNVTEARRRNVESGADVTDEKANLAASVTLVTVVTPPSERGRRVCAQCNSDSEPLHRRTDGTAIVYLHAECMRFWKADQKLERYGNATISAEDNGGCV